MPLGAMKTSAARDLAEPAHAPESGAVQSERTVGGPLHPVTLCPSGDRSPCAPAYDAPCDDIGKMGTTLNLMLSGFENLARMQLEPAAQQHLPALLCLLRQFHALLSKRPRSSTELYEMYVMIMRELDKFPNRDVLGMRGFITRKYNGTLRSDAR